MRAATLNPLTVLVSGACAWILILGLNSVIVSAVIAVVALAYAAVCTRSLTVPIAVILLVLPVGMSMFLIHAPYGTDHLVAFISRDGLAVAGALTLRFSALMASLLALMSAVRIPDLVKALQVVPGGNRISYIVGSALQLLPQAKRTVSTVRDANALAGRTLGWRTIVPNMVVPVLTHLLQESVSRGYALETSGLGSARRCTVLVPVPDSRLERQLRWIIPIVCCGVVLWM